jgi:hypothetical protein
MAGTIFSEDLQQMLAQDGLDVGHGEHHTKELTKCRIGDFSQILDFAIVLGAEGKGDFEESCPGRADGSRTRRA